MLRCLFAASLIGLSTVAVAQDVDERALEELDKKGATTVPVVREPAGAVELRAAMRRIALFPDDADALADAGNAALTLGDANAALNFFTRANAIRPRNARIISGLASATVRTENPFEALRLFDDAVRLGVADRSIAADRALAFDLLGNFARAQQDYNLARGASPSEDLIVRQAISLSLMGQKNDADAMLVPLLQKNNPAAWRARAFMLAARGDYRESTKVTQGFMDVRSAQKMERYLRLMPDLTRAQQAAAIHLGHFPASNIGRDSEDVRRVAATIPAVEPARNDSRLIPSGEPLGQKKAKEKPAKISKKAAREREREAKAKAEASKSVIAQEKRDPVQGAKTDKTALATEAARVRVAEAKVATMTVAKAGDLPPPETARPLVRVALPAAEPPVRGPQTETTTNWPPGTGGSSPAIAATNKSQPVASPSIPAPDTNSGVVTSAAMQGPSESGAPVATTATNPAPAIIRPADVTPPAPTITKPPFFDLAVIVGAIEIPESEQKPSAVPVDLKKLRPAAPKIAAVDAAKAAKVDPKAKGAKIDPKAKETKVDPKAKEKAAAAANPARFWVQIATGEAKALGFDYGRWQKKKPDLFKGKSGWTSAWGKTSRLLVGPFGDLKASKKWEADFKKAGGDGFAWKSEIGVVVTALKGK
ncbi:MAG: hypothetical protein ABI668_08475 [Sphingorhabdus sp.]